MDREVCLRMDFVLAIVGCVMDARMRSNLDEDVGSWLGREEAV